MDFSWLPNRTKSKRRLKDGIMMSVWYHSASYHKAYNWSMRWLNNRFIKQSLPIFPCPSSSLSLRVMKIYSVYFSQAWVRLLMLRFLLNSFLSTRTLHPHAIVQIHLFLVGLDTKCSEHSHIHSRAMTNPPTSVYNLSESKTHPHIWVLSWASVHYSNPQLTQFLPLTRAQPWLWSELSEAWQSGADQ